MKVKRKPIELTAITYNGKNFEDVEEFFYIHKVSEYLLEYFDIGNTLVLAQDGIRIISKEEFEKDWEVVER